jgi:hypothetical protein
MKPSEIAQQFREDSFNDGGSDIRVLQKEREKAVAVISSFATAVAFCIIARIGWQEKVENSFSLIVLTFGLGALSAVAWVRMKRATKALDQLLQGRS